jgi:hypothetical protein
MMTIICTILFIWIFYRIDRRIEKKTGHAPRCKGVLDLD